MRRTFVVLPLNRKVDWFHFWVEKGVQWVVLGAWAFENLSRLWGGQQWWKGEIGKTTCCLIWFCITTDAPIRASTVRIMKWSVPVLLMHAKHAGIHVIRATRTRNTSETTRNTNVDCTYCVLSTTQYECTWTRNTCASTRYTCTSHVLRDITCNTSDHHVLRAVSTYYVWLSRNTCGYHVLRV